MKSMVEIENVKVTEKEDQAFRRSSQSDTFFNTENEHVAMETADNVHSIPQFSEEIAFDELINIGPEDDNSNMEVINAYELESYNDAEINLNAKEHEKQTIVQLEEEVTEVVPQEEQVTEVVPQEEQVTEVVPQEEQATEVVPQEEQVTEVVPQEEQATEVVPQEEQVTKVVPQEEQATEVVPQEEQVTEVVPQEEQATEVVPQEEQVTKVVPQEEQIPEACVRMRNSYVKSRFTCDSSVEMDDEDKQLREYWTHALQTSKSSGEIVEEIVKVMKNHQKTHDLMCPMCGSCVTRTIILRKRKRSNLISVERWYPDSLVQESERQPEITEENNSSPQYNGEDKEMETQDNEQLTEAYGCLTCFSLFFEKGCKLLTERETFDCFPFLCPFYPWGITNSDSKSSGTAQEFSSEKAIGRTSTQNIPALCNDINIDSVEQAGNIHYFESRGTDCISMLAPALLPTYPWGLSQISAAIHPELSVEKASDETSLENFPELRDYTTDSIKQDRSPQYASSEGSHSTGSADHSSSEVKYSSYKIHSVDGDLENISADVRDNAVNVITSDFLSQSPYNEILNTHCTDGLGSALSPEYPSGTFSKANQQELFIDIVADGNSTQNITELHIDTVESVEQTRNVQNSSFEGTNYGLSIPLLPKYPWGLSLETAASPPNLNMEKASGKTSPQSMEEMCDSTIQSTDKADNLQDSSREGTQLTCGVVPAVLPTYPWGSSLIPAASPPNLNMEEASGKTSPQSMEEMCDSTIQITDKADNLQDSSREGTQLTCGVVPAVLPTYPWGSSLITTAISQDLSIDIVRGRTSTQTSSELHIDTIESAKQHRNAQNSSPEESNWISTASLPAYPWELSPETEVLADVKSSAYSACDSSVSVEDIITDVQDSSICVGDMKADDISQLLHHKSENACGIGPVLLPEYTWGTFSKVKGMQICEEQRKVSSNTGLQSPKSDTVKAEVADFTCGLGPILSEYCGGQTYWAADRLDQTASEQVKTYIQQECRIETYEASDILSMVSSKDDQFSKITSSWQENDRVEVVTIFNAAINIDESLVGKAEKQLLSTSLDLRDKGSPNRSRNDSEDSNGERNFQHKCEIETSIILEDLQEKKETVQIANSYVISQDPCTAATCILSIDPSDIVILEADIGNQAIHAPSSCFQWSAENENPDEIKVLPSVNEETPFKPFLNGSEMSKSSDLTTPLLGTEDEIEEGIEIRVTTDTTGLPDDTSREVKLWEILKPIVYGGLDISVASLGVTSAAAGANAITRTVVYMGLATLLSGLIVFYRNVINLYSYHKDHFTDVVGITIGLHGTIALVSYVVFGVLSPLIYAFSYRQTDDRDHKFILCCGVTIATVGLLSLGKAKVSNKGYVRTLCAYILVLVVSSIIGYLTAEHVAELLDSWGI